MAAIQNVMFRCEKCPFESHSARYLKQHKTYKHYNEGVIYRCDICLQVFVYPNSLYTHKKEVHDGIIYKCKLCGFISNSERAVKTHESQFHNNDDKKEFFCEPCDKVITNTTKRRHVEKHRHERRKEKSKLDSLFHCAKCDFKTEREGCLKKHNTNKHSYNLIYCDFCSFNTPNETKLELHNIKEHSMLRCDRCDYETKFKDKMNYHQTLMHDLQCTVCSFTTKSPTHLKKHNNLIHGEFITCDHILGGIGPCGAVSETMAIWFEHRKTHKLTLHECLECDFISTNKGDISPHITFVHKSASCSFCKDRFSSGALLEKHMFDIHKDSLLCCEECTFYTSHKRTLRSHLKLFHYKCDVCKEKFNYLELIEKHQMQTCRKMCYVCKDCDLKFSYPRAYYDHMKNHTKFRPRRKLSGTTTCEVCNKSFKNRFNLERHKPLHVKKKGKSKSKLFCTYCDKYFTRKNFLEEHKLSHASMEQEKEIVSHNEQKQEEYVEADFVEPKEEDNDIKSEVDDEAREGGTFVCPLSSCTFMTSTYSKDVGLDHYKSAHPHMKTNEIKFMRL